MTDEIKKWEELFRETVYEKYSQVIEKIDFRLPNGKVFDYYIRQSSHPVCVLALTKNNEVILAKQFRPGPNEVLLELPGGGRNSNENPEKSMARELLEETGYKGKIKLVTRCIDCGYSTTDRYCFVATECEKISEPKLDENEFIETVLMPLKEFREHLRSGRLTDVEVGYLGLDYLKLL